MGKLLTVVVQLRLLNKPVIKLYSDQMDRSSLIQAARQNWSLLKRLERIAFMIRFLAVHLKVCCFTGHLH